jgi:ankyrin repeat protein
MFSLTVDKVKLEPGTVTNEMLKVVAHKSLRIFEMFWDHRVMGLEYDFLKDAVQSNTVAIVAYSSLESINKQHEQGETVLHLACKSLNYDIIEYLLQNGADPNITTDKGSTPLDTLIDKVRYYERDRFSIKTEHKSQLRIIPLLIRYGAHLNSVSDISDLDLAICVHTNGIPMVSEHVYNAYRGIVPEDLKVEDLFKRQCRFTPLLVYAKKHEAIAIKLINQYWDAIPGYLRECLLIEAVEHSKANLVHVLLKAGMDPNMKLDPMYYPKDLLCIAIFKYNTPSNNVKYGRPYQGHDSYGHVLLALLDSGAVVKKHHYDMKREYDDVLDYLEVFDLKGHEAE